MKALVAFGFGSVKGLSNADFASPGTVVALGHPPMRIDLLTSVSGVTFERAWRRRRAATVAGVRLSVIGVRTSRRARWDHVHLAAPRRSVCEGDRGDTPSRGTGKGMTVVSWEWADKARPMERWPSERSATDSQKPRR